MMLTPMTRRNVLVLLGAGCAAVLTARFTPAMAQESRDTAFVRQLSEKMIAIINGPGSMAEKRQQILPLIDQNVDVDGIARFCLGRFWRTATPAQQQDYLRLFHDVLLNNVGSKLGEFQGVTFKLTQTTQREGETLVGTLITRPNQKPNNVQWVVEPAGGRPKIMDVIAEGTSLRLTQRSDYAAYLSRNNNDVGALINAMRQQVERS